MMIKIYASDEAMRGAGVVFRNHRKKGQPAEGALSRISPRRKFFEEFSGTEHAEVSEVDSGLLNDAQHLIARLTASVMVFQGGGYRRRHVYEGPAGPVGQREAYGPDV